VACAGASFGCSVEVVVPEKASRAKVEGIRRYGASVIPFGQSSHERRHFARSKAEAEGKVFVHSHDDPLVICGQGTIGTEILEDLKDVDAVLVPVGGGGLIAGVSIAVKEINPHILVYGVEPEIGCCMKMSLEKKERVELTETPPTIADGLRGTIPGELPFNIAQKNVDGMISVKEDTIREAVRLLAMGDKLVVEPSGAVVAAALLEGSSLKKGSKICIVLSGGNMEIEKFAQILSGGQDG
jgi:threonine dehydratase